MEENDYIPVYSMASINDCIKSNIKNINSIIPTLDYEIRQSCENMKINSYKVFRLFFYLLYKATENRLNDTTIKISRKEYLSLFDTFDKVDILNNLFVLTGLRIQSQKKKASGFISVFSNIFNQEQEYGYIKAKFNEDFFEELKAHNKKTLMYFYFNKNVFHFNLKQNPHSFMLAMRIFYNKRVNLKKARANKITIRTLLDYCNFNDSSSNFKNGQLSYCVREPIERDLNQLRDIGITWHYENDVIPKNFNDFLEATIIYNIAEYDDLKQIVDLKLKNR